MFPKQTSPNSSWYILSDGSKVQGKANAVAAEAKLGNGNDESQGEYVVNNPAKTTTGKPAAPIVEG